jgi:predicted HAD superfamily Cof-like phosphohydrolase
MGFSKIATVSLVFSFLLGCSPDRNAAATGAAAAASAAPPGKTVFDPLTNDLAKAKAVQSAADSNADATRQAVDRQERGDSSP